MLVVHVLTFFLPSSSLLILLCLFPFLLSYMRRHPCILDRGASFLERHSWIYQAIVLVFTLAGVIVGTMIGIRF